MDERLERVHFQSRAAVACASATRVWQWMCTFLDSLDTTFDRAEWASRLRVYELPQSDGHCPPADDRRGGGGSRSERCFGVANMSRSDAHKIECVCNVWSLDIYVWNKTLKLRRVEQVTTEKDCRSAWRMMLMLVLEVGWWYSHQTAQIPSTISSSFYCGSRSPSGLRDAMGGTHALCALSWLRHCLKHSLGCSDLHRSEHHYLQTFINKNKDKNKESKYFGNTMFLTVRREKPCGQYDLVKGIFNIWPAVKIIIDKLSLST